MPDLASIVLAACGMAFLAALAWFGLVSAREREPRATRLALLLALLTGLPLLAAARSPQPVPQVVLGGLGVFALLTLLALALPVGRSVSGNGRPARRVDERGIMFARKRLVPGSPEYDTYYALHPEQKAGDDRTRALPGLLSPHAALVDPLEFAAAKASFGITEALRDEVDGPVASSRQEIDPHAASELVRRLARYHGALEVGITELRPYHVYSHVGRGSGRWGEPIELEHRWAVAFTVEMDHRVMQHAPGAPVVAESARQYVESAKIAIQAATVIRSMGYAARAHIDGNYRVIAPLVALDAGLGEIGRMGLLMTPRLGPRVRLGVITTELPLETDEPGDDPSMIDFCRICKKCAECCPSRSIPFGEREPVDGGVRWAIDADSCFRYWNVVGTDCGRCMAVCPYSHPDNVAHNLVRRAIRRSEMARRAMLRMDDLFYGRRPPTRQT